MTRQVSIAEARDHFTALVKTAERGLPVALTRRGKPVAVLLSVDEYTRLTGRSRDPYEAWLEWRKAHPKGIEGFTDEELATLRDRSAGREPRFP